MGDKIEIVAAHPSPRQPNTSCWESIIKTIPKYHVDVELYEAIVQHAETLRLKPIDYK